MSHQSPPPNGALVGIVISGLTVGAVGSGLLLWCVTPLLTQPWSDLLAVTSALTGSACMVALTVIVIRVIERGRGD